MEGKTNYGTLSPCRCVMRSPNICSIFHTFDSFVILNPVGLILQRAAENKNSSNFFY